MTNLTTLPDRVFKDEAGKKWIVKSYEGLNGQVRKTYYHLENGAMLSRPYVDHDKILVRVATGERLKED